jgi:hypothetical protein
MVQLAGDEQFFHENEAQLSERFAGKVLVIRQRRVVAVYENLTVAQREAAREFGGQTFLVKPIARNAFATSGGFMAL